MKKHPNRMCVACREILPQNTLLRIAKDKDSNVKLSFGCKEDGKGAYVCNNTKCVEKLERDRILNRVFSQAVDEKIYKDLKTYVNAMNKIVTYINFEIKKNELRKGIKSILKNKEKISLILILDSLGNSTRREINYLRNKYNIDVIKIKREHIKEITTNICTVKVLGIQDKNIKKGILDVLAEVDCR